MPLEPARSGMWRIAMLAPVPRNYSLEYLSGLTGEEFREVFKESPVKRAKLEGLKRNVAVARDNSI